MLRIASIFTVFWLARCGVIAKANTFYVPVLFGSGLVLNLYLLLFPHKCDDKCLIYAYITW